MVGGRICKCEKLYRKSLSSLISYVFLVDSFLVVHLVSCSLIILINNNAHYF